ncbi:MAG: hypothetical protein ACRC33_23050 [Gemmataceae bacterium]
MSYETLYAAVAPVFESYGMEMAGPEESHDFLTVTDMVAFGLVANWFLRLLDAAEDDARAVIHRLGPFGGRLAEQIERGYDTWLMETAYEVRDGELLGEVIRLGINGTSWAQWQAEAAKVPMTEAFLDECVQSMVKTTWFEVAEGCDVEVYLEEITPARMLGSLHETIGRQARELGIPVL